MKRKHRFTLVELLIVIAIIAILAAMLFAGLGGASGRAEKAKAKAQIVDLRNAIAAFEMEYNKLPKPKNNSGNTGYNGDALTPNEYKWLIYTLQGVNPDKDGNTEEKDFYYLCYKDKNKTTLYGNLNTRKKKFLSIQGGSEGEFQDPWDQPFKVIFESSYGRGIDNSDGKIPGLKPEKDSSNNDKNIPPSVVIWSKGSDKDQTTGEEYFNADNNEDNVYSVETSWSPKVGHTIQN